MPTKEACVSGHTLCTASKMGAVNQDRRFASNTRNIFFKLKKHLIHQVQHCVFHKARKAKLQGGCITAQDFKNPGTREKLLDGTYGHREFAALKGSPAYWDKARGNAFAMIRQLGAPTWFFTYSAAERNWPELISALYELKTGISLTEEEALALDDRVKYDLVKEDPVTCARHFYHRWNAYRGNVLEKCPEALGGLVDFFYRYEFQHRGSAHVHGLAWTENAPAYDPEDPINQDVVDYIDTYQTCSISGLSPHMLTCQWHKHKPGCRKSNSKHQHCRYHFPKPPMPSTHILKPLTVKEAGSAEAHKELRKRWYFLHARMGEMLDPADVDLSSFYAALGTTEEEFQLCLRASLDRPTVFLKRTPREIWINGYMKNGGEAWGANMDIQFVLDPYAAANYVVAYMMKGNRSTSKLMEQAIIESKCGNLSIKEAINYIGNRLLRAQEVCAQEAVFHLLGLDFVHCSRKAKYVDARPPCDRSVNLMNETQINGLADDADIVLPTQLDSYSNRPGGSEDYDVCLADYICWYEPSRSRAENCEADAEMEAEAEQDGTAWMEDSAKECPAEDPDSEQADAMDTEQGGMHPEQLPHRIGNRHKRRRPAILKHSYLKMQDDFEQYCRARLMLFKPWRDEETDLLGDHESYDAAYKADEETYQHIAKRYGLDDANRLQNYLMQLENGVGMESDDEGDLLGSVAPADADGTNMEPGLFKEHVQGGGGDFNLSSNRNKDGVSYAEKTKEMRYTVSDEEYGHMARVLNVEQRVHFYHVLHNIKHGEEPFYEFLTGGAGVGKSVETRAIAQAVMRWANSQPGSEDDCNKVLVMAYTNKASANVSGTTPFSGLGIPTNTRYQDMRPLADANGKKAEYQRNLRQLKLVIIDEVSFIDANLLNMMDARLRQIMGVDKPFGGIPVLFVGDLFQLLPGLGNCADASKLVFGSPDVPQRAPPTAPTEAPPPLTTRSKGKTDTENPPAPAAAPAAPAPSEPRVQFRNMHYHDLVPNFWQEHVCVYELNEIMRQKDQKEWAELLNRLRENKLTDADRTFLQSLVIKIPFNHPDYPKLAPHQFTVNKLIDAHNQKVMNYIPGPVVKLKARDLVAEYTKGGDYQGCQAALLKQAAKAKKKHTQGLASCLEFKVGARVEIGVTYQAQDNLSNGFEGYIRQIDQQVPGHADSTTVIWVEFDDGKVGKKTRLACQHQRPAGVQETWTPVRRIDAEFKVTCGDGIHATVRRSQFPLQLANARSTIRSQGVTEHNGGAVGYQDPHCPPHTHYTTLARYTHTHKDGKQVVHILNDVCFDKIKVNPLVVAEMARLREKKQVELSYSPLVYSPGPHFTVGFHNCRSLHRHLLDVDSDQDIASCSLLFLSETRAKKSDSMDYALSSFPHQSRNDACHGAYTDASGHPFHGLACYSKAPFVKAPRHISSPGLDATIAVCTGPGGLVIAVGLYISPKLTTTAALHVIFPLLQQELSWAQEAGKHIAGVVIGGDFNVDMNTATATPKQATLTALMQSQGMVLASDPSQPTTELGSHLDSIWVRSPQHPDRPDLPCMQVGVSPTYWSDHYLSWFQINPAVHCCSCGKPATWGRRPYEHCRACK